MLDKLGVEQFTVFSQADFGFTNGLNVVIGENGTGKTHVLKLAYSILSVIADGDRFNRSDRPAKGLLEVEVARKLVGVFKPDALGRLARRNRRGRQRSAVTGAFNGDAGTLSFEFHTASDWKVEVTETPRHWLDKPPVYLPTRELLTIYRGFVSLYETSHLPFDETWRDTCILLGAPLAKGPREQSTRELLVPLEDALGGRVVLNENGGFYLSIDQVQMEMPLVAEGLRKIAMLARLIATGSLADKGCLLWDEPEANLNPRTVKVVAKTILGLCQRGIQVVLATHSLFLLREFDILMKYPEYGEIKSRYFGLHRRRGGVEVQQGTRIEDVGDIPSLEEELNQSDRFLAKE